ncbi:MAG: fasciclin domain-containing protein [Bacteroidetes bacterium]|nr:MAG: fasciclin domain-containing protein [Bacteroidota bacterium]
MKILRLFALMIALPFFMSCEEEVVNEPQNIVEIASSDARFSTLVDALVKANLATTLEGTGPFTVFAPTNQAFQQLFTDLGVSGLSELSAEALRPILLYHVLGADVRSTDLSATYVSTLSPAPAGNTVSLKVDVSPSAKLNANVNITDTDIAASNGVIHVIDQVLLPPNVVELALNNENFSILVAALTRADLSADLVAVLSGEGPFTVFAPTNQAFVDLLDSNPSWNSLDDIDAATLEAVLTYHVLAGTNLSSDLISDGAQVTTVQGSTLTANVADGGVSLTDGQNGQSNVVIANVQGTNGVVHAIDRVLLP